MRHSGSSASQVTLFRNAEFFRDGVKIGVHPTDDTVELFSL